MMLIEVVSYVRLDQLICIAHEKRKISFAKICRDVKTEFFEDNLHTRTSRTESLKHDGHQSILNALHENYLLRSIDDDYA
ncbi:hypothetical protein DPMN_135069 [Dreissena polymorpha]|uniref:Uncharacterized protein n=1 Tax=Dreissena polymorpha TaxID=45954 RepID=A0A9D4G171_DREPO|nr:hypothetical protein DPMN_135069 [Dreissena polymorpha]